MEQQIKQLRAEKDKAVEEKSAAEAQTTAKSDTIAALEQTKQVLDERISELSEQISELENRPIEVATEIVEKIPDDYITREAYEEMVHSYTEQLDKADEENLAEKRRAYAEKQELEKKISELENRSDSSPEETFKLLCQICRDPLTRLMLFAYKNPGYRRKALKFVEELTNTVKEEENK